MMEMSNIDGAGKTRSPGRGKRNWNAVMSQYAVPKVEFPQSVVPQYIEACDNGQRPKGELTTILRQYVCNLGWTVEFLYDKMPRFRYISPDGKIYMSLRQVCLDLNGTLSPAYHQLLEPLNHIDQRKEVTSSAYPQPQEPLNHMSERKEVISSAYPQPQDPLNHMSERKEVNSSAYPQPQEPLSHMSQRTEVKSSAYPQPQEPLNHMSPRKEVNSSDDEIAVGPELSSQAIIDWYKIGGDRFSVSLDERASAILNAKKYLTACGWKLYYTQKGDKRKLRYESPGGKCYISLRMACKGYLKGESSSGSLGNSNSGHLDLIESGINKRKKKSKPERSPKKFVKGITRSSRRAKEFCVHDSSHRNPRTVLSLLIENNVVLPGAKVQYLNKKDHLHPMGVGEITSTGIKCKCCGGVYGLSAFEAHCRSNYHRPAANIFLEDGRSLMECQMQMVLNRNALKENTCHKLNGKQYPNNDGICAICHYEGELLLCDECPSSFHRSCIGLKDTPEGDWFCPSCCCKICGNKEFHEDTGQSNGNPALSCYQCEHKYHLDCLQIKGSEKLEISPKKWFCSKTCEKIFSGLHSRLGKAVSLGIEDLTWTLLRSRTSDYCQDDSSDIEMLTESYSKLNIALEVVHECFEPMKNFRTGKDIADDVIFSRGSDQARVNFQGFYTVVIEKNEDLITVATIRVHGEKVAELPLICTRFQHRGHGMCKLLMNELEKILEDLGIERLILPAAPEVLSTWTSSFGFSKMTESERLELLDYTFLDFRDTFMCQKFIGKRKSIS